MYGELFFYKNRAKIDYWLKAFSIFLMQLLYVLKAKTKTITITKIPKSLISTIIHFDNKEELEN